MTNASLFKRRLLGAGLGMAGMGAVGIVGTAHAEGLPVVFGGEAVTKLQAEVSKPNGGGAKANVYDDSEVSAYVNWSDWLSVNSDMKLERQRNDNLDDYYPDRHTAFRSEGLTLRQLYVTLRPVEGVEVFSGKIHPKFGSAYEQTPGQFYNFGTDYEQDERVGGGFAVGLPEFMGQSQFTAETFFLDNSVFSTSLFSQPSLDDGGANRLRRYTMAAGGASNTGNLESFTLSVRGRRVPGLEGLKYQLSFTNEAVHLPGEHTEHGFSVGFSIDPTGDGIPLTHRWGVTPFLEYTHFDNFAGVAGLDRHYAIGGLNFIHGHWNVAMSAGLRRSNDDNTNTNQPFTNALATQESNAWDWQENVTLTYEVMEHLMLGIGYNHVRVSGRSSNTFGPSVGYTWAF